MNESISEKNRDIYNATNLSRSAIKAVAEGVWKLRQTTIDIMAGNSEVIANITLAYRALEDSSMRLGKALQHLDGGASVYDPKTVTGPTPNAQANRIAQLEQQLGAALRQLEALQVGERPGEAPPVNRGPGGEAVTG